jgi:Ser-tRNA(Ala) deacylase AlaX
MEKEIFPPMHTAEHLINWAMVKNFGCNRCFRDHIEKKKSKLDYKFERNLEISEVEKIEKDVNELIEKKLPVYEEFVPVEDAKKKYNLSRLPIDVSGNIRIIKIGDYDAAPCQGPHIKSTKEIGGLKIISTDYEDGVLRIRYKLNI